MGRQATGWARARPMDAQADFFFRAPAAFGAAFFPAADLRAAVFRGAALRGPVLGLAGPLSRRSCEQLGRPFQGDLLHRVAPPEGRVGGAVGDVGPEAALADHDRSARHGVGAELAEGLGRRGAAPRLRLGQQGQGLIEGDAEQLVLVVEAAAVRPLLHVRPVAAVEGRDLLAVGGVLAEHPRQGEQLQGLLQADGVDGHALEERGGAGLLLARRVGVAQLDVGAEAPGPGDDGQSRRRVGAEDLVPAGRRQQLQGPFHGQLVGRQALGNGRGFSVERQVGPVTAHPYRDLPALVVAADGDRVDVAGVDVVEPLAHHRLEAGRPVPEVELRQPRHPLLAATGDAVEVVLHPGGEGVVDEVGEVALHQGDDGEGGPRRHEGGALAPGVAPVLDGAEDRRVGRRAAHPHLLEGLDQRRLGEAGRRVGDVVLGLQGLGDEGVAGSEDGQAHLPVLQHGVGVVGALHVGPQEAGELDRAAAGREHRVLAGRRRRPQADLDALASGVGHLGGDGALPDEVVEGPLVGGQLPADLVGCAERLAGGTDGLVGLLGVLHLLLVATGRLGDVRRARTARPPAAGQRTPPSPTATCCRCACR